MFNRQCLHQILLLLLAALLIFTSNLTAQVHDTLRWKLKEKQPFLNVIKTNPIPFFLGSVPMTSEYRISMEYVTGPQQSSQIGLSYLGKWWFFSMDTSFFSEVLEVNGFRFQGTFKFYMNEQVPFLANIISDYDNAPYGPYLAPHVSFATAKITTAYLGSTDVFLRFTQFNIAGLAGYQAILFNAIAVDVFTGLGYKYNELISHEPNKTTVVNLKKEMANMGLIGWYYSGPVKIYLGFNIGFIF